MKTKKSGLGLALSQEQYRWLAEAIGGWRQVQQTFKEMQRPSRHVLFETLPNLNGANALARKF